jgi:hypothetical protein
MVQRYGEYTYRQGWMKGIVGEERRGKEMDRCSLTDTVLDSVWNTYVSSSNVRRYIYYLLEN